jgi:hypothetical protein
MAIVYLVRNPRWNAERQVLLASVHPTWKDEDGTEHATNLFGELETIVDRYLRKIEPGNADLPLGNGLANFPDTPRITAERAEPES